MGLKAYLDGILGEDKACKFLKKQGFEILKRNFHSKFGEIDIIAKKDEILHFIEVKFTQNDYEVSERLCRRKNKISIWKNKTSIKVEILFFYKP
ncbi:TPA_asm: hypothetical protein GD813_03985 [Campylobacter jejuni]|nr:hypothetical protein [Campylobacter jejuni]